MTRYVIATVVGALGALAAWVAWVPDNESEAL